MSVEFFSAVLIYSKNHIELAKFYKEIIGIPLEDEQHGNSPLHYGCELGDIHFAIHPADENDEVGVGSMKLAFEVFDMNSHIKKLESHGVKLLYPPKPMGPMLLTAIKDPDGNTIEFTQLGEPWYQHLADRRKNGHDIIQRFQQKQH